MGDTIQLPGQTIAWYKCARGRILKMLGQSPGSPQIPMNLFVYMEVNAMFIFYDGYDGLVTNSSSKFQGAGVFKFLQGSVYHWEWDGSGPSFSGKCPSMGCCLHRHQG